MSGVLSSVWESVREVAAAHTVPSGLALLGLAVTLGLAAGSIRVARVSAGGVGVLFSAAWCSGNWDCRWMKRGAGVSSGFWRHDHFCVCDWIAGRAGVFDLAAPGGVAAESIVDPGGGSWRAAMTGAVVRGAHLDRKIASGLFAGGRLRRRRALAAGQEAALRHAPGRPSESVAKDLQITGMAYTVTYPFGVVGPILVIAALRRMLGVRVPDERKSLIAAEEVRRPPIEVIEFEVTQPEQAGIALKDHALIRGSGVVLARLLRDHRLIAPNGDTEIQVGDIYRAVGPRTALARVVKGFGRMTTAGLDHVTGDVERLDSVVTRTKVLRKSLRELNLIRRTGVTIVRVHRAGVELTPRASLKLQFGDQIVAVGPVAGPLQDS